MRVTAQRSGGTSRILPSSIDVNGLDCSESGQIADVFKGYLVNCARNVTKDLPVMTPDSSICTLRKLLIMGVCLRG